MDGRCLGWMRPKDPRDRLLLLHSYHLACKSLFLCCFPFILTNLSWVMWTWAEGIHASLSFWVQGNDVNVRVNMDGVV